MRAGSSDLCWFLMASECSFDNYLLLPTWLILKLFFVTSLPFEISEEWPYDFRSSDSLVQRVPHEADLWELDLNEVCSYLALYAGGYMHL